MSEPLRTQVLRYGRRSRCQDACIEFMIVQNVHPTRCVGSHRLVKQLGETKGDPAARKGIDKQLRGLVPDLLVEQFCQGQNGDRLLQSFIAN